MLNQHYGHSSPPTDLSGHLTYRLQRGTLSIHRSYQHSLYAARTDEECALSILHALCPSNGFHCGDRFYPIAAIDRLSAQFVDAFLSSIPRDPCEIDIEVLYRWLTEACAPCPDSESVARNPSAQSLDSDHPLNPDIGDIADEAYFICGLDPATQRPVFNITQRVWLFDGVAMDWRGGNEAALNLAVNILADFLDLDAQDIDSSVVNIAHEFTSDFVACFPSSGACVLYDGLADWVDDHEPM